MSTFVLVPGAWHGGWCFRPVVEVLRAAGHKAFATTLTGLGERAHLKNRGINLDTHVADVAGVLDAEELRDVILLGHSYGGCVISGVAQQRPGAIRTLVYLDAIVLTDGESLFDHVSEEFRAAVVAGANASDDGYLVPTPTMEFLGVGPEHAAWMQRRLTPHPIGTAMQPLRLRPFDPRIGRVYIDCDTPSIPPTHLSKRRVHGAPGWDYRTLHTGHDAFVSEPSALAAILLALAG